MIKYVFATRNKKSGNYNLPQFYDFQKENAAEVFTISAKETPASGIEAIKELEVYYIGTFDTKTGVLETDIDFIIDLGSVIDGKQTN